MGGDGQEIGAEIVEVDGYMAGSGRRVDVHQHAPLTTGGHDLRDRLDGADLVVGPLAVDQGNAPALPAAVDTESGRMRPVASTSRRVSQAGPAEPGRSAQAAGASRSDASRTALCSTAARATRR